MLSVPRRFENLDRVLNCLAFYSVVAWRLMYVCYLGRECPEIDCEVTGDLELLAGEVNWRKQIIAQRTDLHGTSWLFDGRKLHCFCRRHWMVIDPQTLETGSSSPPKSCGIDSGLWRCLKSVFHSCRLCSSHHI